MSAIPDGCIEQVVAHLREEFPKKDVDRLARALGIIVGTDAMIALTDGVGLDVPAAKKALLGQGRERLGHRAFAAARCRLACSRLARRRCGGGGRIR